MTENASSNQTSMPEGMDDNDSKGTGSGSNAGHSGGSHGTRLTRSRANQGTPGPNDQGNDSPSKFLRATKKKNIFTFQNLFSAA